MLSEYVGAFVKSDISFERMSGTLEKRVEELERKVEELTSLLLRKGFESSTVPRARPSTIDEYKVLKLKDIFFLKPVESQDDYYLSSREVVPDKSVVEGMLRFLASYNKIARDQFEYMIKNYDDVVVPLGRIKESCTKPGEFEKYDRDGYSRKASDDDYFLISAFFGYYSYEFGYHLHDLNLGEKLIVGVDKIAGVLKNHNIGQLNNAFQPRDPERSFTVTFVVDKKRYHIYHFNRTHKDGCCDLTLKIQDVRVPVLVDAYQKC